MSPPYEGGVRGGSSGVSDASVMRPMGRASLAATLLWSGLASGQSPSRPPEVWAIIVGVGNYAHSAIPDRPAPARDANRIQQWIAQAGWDDRHQILLSDFGNTDPGEPDSPALNIRPTKRNLDWAFHHWLFTRKFQAGDIVVFYFAGESRTVVKSQGEHLDPRVDHYLLPMEAVDDNPEQTGWSIDQAVDECVRRRLQVVCWLATAPDDRRGALIPAPPRIPPHIGPAAARQSWRRGQLARSTGTLAGRDGLAGLRSAPSARPRRGIPARRSPGRSWRPSASPAPRPLASGSRSRTWRAASVTSSRIPISGSRDSAPWAVSRPR